MCQSPWTTPKYFYPPYLWTTRFFPLYANFAKWPFLFALDFGLNDIKAQNILQIFKDSELFNWLLKIYEWSFYDKDEVVYKKYVINLSNRNSVTKKKSTYHALPSLQWWRHDRYFPICDKLCILLRSPWNVLLDKIFPLHFQTSYRYFFSKMMKIVVFIYMYTSDGGLSIRKAMGFLFILWNLRNW